jgi:hypothetical protein
MGQGRAITVLAAAGLFGLAASAACAADLEGLPPGPPGPPPPAHVARGPAPPPCKLVPMPQMNLEGDDVNSFRPTWICVSRGLYADTLPPPPPRPQRPWFFWW